ncbi:MAG: hypothetical protein Q9191_004196 [Dirinaria sp. TL-2023a]
MAVSTFTAPVPFLEPYRGNEVGRYSVPNATGPIDPGVPGELAYQGAGDVQGCAVGSFRGTPTVEVLLVSRDWQARVAFAHSTVRGGLTPTETVRQPKKTVGPSIIEPLIGSVSMGGQGSPAAPAGDAARKPALVKKARTTKALNQAHIAGLEAVSTAAINAAQVKAALA